MMAKLKTRAQIAREQMHKEVIAYFIKVKKENPNVKDWRYFCYVGDKMDLTPQGVRRILIQHGIIPPTQKSDKQITIEI